jgi:hypothetical protein
MPGWYRTGYALAWGPAPAWDYGPYAAAPTAEQETESLKAQAQWMEQQLEAISKRLEELRHEE